MLYYYVGICEFCNYYLYDRFLCCKVLCSMFCVQVSIKFKRKLAVVQQKHSNFGTYLYKTSVIWGLLWCYCLLLWFYDNCYFVQLQRSALCDYNRLLRAITTVCFVQLQLSASCNFSVNSLFGFPFRD